MATVTMKELLEAGVHFGHQVRRWNPKMKEYIFGERNGIYIIDLQKTQRMFKEALKYVTGIASEGSDKIFLFVGTKRQAQDAIKEEAVRCNQYYINQRWLGGLLTNFQTIQKSIKRYKEIEAMQADGRIDQYAKKERLQIERERLALEKNLSGIKEMRRLPDAIFIIDTNKEEIAVKEANRLNIPVVAVVDTNCNPDGISQIIPGNDDALRAVRLFAARIADAIVEGQAVAQAKEAEEAAIRAEQGITMEQAAPRDRRPRGERGERGDRGDRRDRTDRGDRRPPRGDRPDRPLRQRTDIRPALGTPAVSGVAPVEAAVVPAAPVPEVAPVETIPVEATVPAPETSETNAA
ncbi:MAG: 30S ribosomal protein S2 [Blastocatellia bacterium]|nr:30S ribosomal protein S2 [Blastocatellia bacterium]